MKISLTDFVDFVALTGGRKLSKVREIKERGAYHPKTDYYKGIREAIIALHSTSGGIESIEKEKVNSIICFLETELLQRCDESHLFTVLDVPSSKLHYKDKRGRDFMPLIYGEAESFAAMWKRV